MQRREAIGLFKEIYECSPQSFVFDSVLLRQDTQLFSSAEESFVLQINAVLEGSLRHAIETIVKRHNLEVEEQGNSLSIHSPKTQQIVLA